MNEKITKCYVSTSVYRDWNIETFIGRTVLWYIEVVFKFVNLATIRDGT